MLFNVRKILSILFYSVITIAAIILEFHFNFDPVKAGLITTGFMVLAIAMQYIFPEERKPRERGELLTDVLYFIFGSVVFGAIRNMLVQTVTRWLAPGLLVSSGIIAPGHGLDILPFWPQVILFMLCIDLGFYWTHRLSHQVPWLFRFHSIHHMPHRVSVLNGSRTHPIDAIWRRVVPTLLVLQLGFSKDAAGMGMLMMMMLGVFQHMNVDFDFGFLNRIIGTNQGHRWHHSTVVSESLNYGLLSIWDQVWGTYRVTDRPQRPKEMGLEDQGVVPIHNFFYQLVVPFLSKKKTHPLAMPVQTDRA